MMSATENSGKDSSSSQGEEGGAPSRCEDPGPGMNAPNFRQGVCGDVAGFYFNIELPKVEGFRGFVDWHNDGRVHLLRIALWAYGVDLDSSCFEGRKVVKTVTVSAVVAKSPAAHDSRLKAGDVLVEVNSRPPASINADEDDLADLMISIFENKEVILNVFRKGDGSYGGGGPLLGTQFSTRITRDPKFHDVIFEVENEELPSYRVLIADRSPVFEAMLTHEMQEKKTGRIKVKDFEPRIFRAVLNFIYTDRLETMGNNVTDLMELARAGDFFDIKGLKDKVSQRLLYYINRETAVEILVLGKKYGFLEEAFTKCAIHFIAMWSPEIISKPSFACLKDDPELLMRLYQVKSQFNHEDQFFVTQLCLGRIGRTVFPWEMEDPNSSDSDMFEFRSDSISPPSLGHLPDFPDEHRELPDGSPRHRIAYPPPFGPRFLEPRHPFPEPPPAPPFAYNGFHLSARPFPYPAGSPSPRGPRPFYSRFPSRPQLPSVWPPTHEPFHQVRFAPGPLGPPWRVS